METIRPEAARQLDSMREQIESLNQALRIDPGDLELPPYDIPQAQLTGPPPPEPLIDSRWTFTDQCQRLIQSKTYVGREKP